jgi:hypothetical protein
MLRIKSDQFRPFPQLKVRKIKTRCDCTTSQCERCGIANPGSEPAARLDDCLQHFPRVRIAAQTNFRVAPVRLDHVYSNRAAVIEMPKLIRPETMESGEVFFIEEEIDRR